MFCFVLFCFLNSEFTLFTLADSYRKLASKEIRINCVDLN